MLRRDENAKAIRTFRSRSTARHSESTYARVYRTHLYEIGDGRTVRARSTKLHSSETEGTQRRVRRGGG